jgi:hypothetical protein
MKDEIDQEKSEKNNEDFEPYQKVVLSLNLERYENP